MLAIFLEMVYKIAEGVSYYRLVAWICICSYVQRRYESGVSSTVSLGENGCTVVDGLIIKTGYKQDTYSSRLTRTPVALVRKSGAAIARR